MRPRMFDVPCFMASGTSTSLEDIARRHIASWSTPAMPNAESDSRMWFMCSSSFTYGVMISTQHV